jgi:tRNA threonylcarbamoyladenosine biosynthesis protein TsaB
MLILSIDTSTKTSSIALHQAGKLVALAEFFVERFASQALTTAIEQLIHNSGFVLKDVQAVAVCKGPGSYTGLRVGVATAKGLCYALKRPLIGISTLETMALKVKSVSLDHNHYICPMIDARRMEVFCAVYSGALDIIRPVQATIIDRNSFSDILVNKCTVFVGDGAFKCKSELSHQTNAVFMEDIYPSAQFAGQLAWQSFQNSMFENTQTFEPFYLKEFVKQH